MDTLTSGQLPGATRVAFVLVTLLWFNSMHAEHSVCAPHPNRSLDLSSYSLAGPVVVTPSYDFLEKELQKAKLTQRKVRAVNL